MIKGIIFDYGGTLDTGGDHWSHVIRAGWDHAGVAANDALFREAYVYGERELERVEHILPHHTFADVLDIKMQIELQYLAQTGNFPPAQVESKAKEIAAFCYQVAKENVGKSKEVLQELAKTYPLVLVSNFYGNIESVLKDFGIFDCFKGVIESAKVGVRKPDSAIFELGLKVLRLPAEEVLVVGDSVKNDIDPARKIGCQTLLIEGKGWDDTPLAHDGPAIRQLDEILNFIENS
ncbi:MAG: HAD family hydrolase [Muribaculaceae bacterium]|nr:HAD family hydrolase [Muribaculaceae bacterium]